MLQKGATVLQILRHLVIKLALAFRCTTATILQIMLWINWQEIQVLLGIPLQVELLLRVILLQIVEEFGLKTRTLIWENLYNNVVRREHHPIRPWLARIKNPLSKNDFYRHTANSAVCNTTDSAWCSGIRDAIAEICPFPSSVEQPVTFPEDITRVNNAPAVKRRPEHLRDKEAYHAHLRSIGVLIR